MRARLNVRRVAVALALAAVTAGLGAVEAGHAGRPEADSVWDYAVVGVAVDGLNDPAVVDAMDSVWD